MAIQLLAAGSARLDFGDLAAIDGLTELSVAVTLKPVTSLTNSRIISKWGNASGEPAFLLRGVDTDEIAFTVNNGLGTQLRGDKTTDSPLAVDTITRVVCRWRASGSEVNIWVNGAARTDTSEFAGTVTALGTTTAAIQVGRETDEGINGQDGEYSEIAIWNRYLDDAEVIQYGNGFAPSFMRRGGILYCPAINAANLAELWGGATPSNTGGTSVAHPAVIYPA